MEETKKMKTPQTKIQTAWKRFSAQHSVNEKNAFRICRFVHDRFYLIALELCFNATLQCIRSMSKMLLIRSIRNVRGKTATVLLALVVALASLFMAIQLHFLFAFTFRCLLLVVALC